MTGHLPLREALHEYLSLRRALGFKLATAGRLLGQFLDYLDSQHATTVTVEHGPGLGHLAVQRVHYLARDPAEHSPWIRRLAAQPGRHCGGAAR